MTDKELDNLFQNRLGSHQMPVPADMWDRVNPHKEKRRRAIIWWWSGLGVAALFLIAGTTMWLYHTSPEKNVLAVSVTKSANNQLADDSAKRTVPTIQPSGIHRKVDLSNVLPKQQKPSQSAGIEKKITSPNALTEQKASSQIALANNKTGHHVTNFYTQQSNRKKNTEAGINQLQNSANNQESGIEKKKNNNNIAKNGQGNNEVGSQKNNEFSELKTPENVSETILQSTRPTTSLKTPDSNAVVANATTQISKAAAIKVKKIPGEKATSLELMIAGYGNSRDVYDPTVLRSTGLVAFGPVSQKEKVLMNSFSINARIEKPLTKNISLKTGLQFLQTHQRVSYDYETVIPSLSITSTGSDTIFSARLQSKQSVIKGTYNSVNVPLLLSYHTNGAKLSLGATAGVLVNVFSWYTGNVPDAGNSGVVTAKNTFRLNTGAALYAGITAAKQVGRFQLFAEPHMQYTLSSITKSSASFRQKITSYGFGVGIRKTIGK